MALVGANRGVSGNATAATSITITPASNFTAGSMALLSLSYDNSGTQGSDPYTSISDTVGNVWTPRIQALNDPGAASAGVAVRIFSSIISALTTANTITVNFNTSTTAKAWTLTEVSSNTSGATVSVVTSSSIGSNGSTQSITTSSIATNDLVLAVLGQEGNGTRTADADTLNGSWSTAQSTGFGTTTGGVEIISQYKIVTASGTQTYNPVATPLGDWIIGWISITELISSEFDPFGINGFFGI